MRSAQWRRVFICYSLSFSLPGGEEFAAQNTPLLSGRLPEDRKFSFAFFYEQIRLEVVTPSRHQRDRWWRLGHANGDIGGDHPVGPGRFGDRHGFGRVLSRAHRKLCVT